jgi:DNA modification methylase
MNDISSSSMEESTERFSHEFEGDIPPDIDIPHRSHILIISRDQSYLTHGLHKFPAKFFPELPRFLIRKYTRVNDVVLDPMCGSGTAVLEAVLNRRRAIGLDIDPIAMLVTKVKTTPINPSTLRTCFNELTESITQHFSDGYKPDLPEFNYRDNWFRDFVLRELGIISDSIQDIQPSFNDNISDFLRVVFSSIIKDVSNADPHCTRTVIRKGNIRDISPGETLSLFKSTLASSIDSMNDFTKVVSNIDRLDCKLYPLSAIETGLKNNSIDLALTSPPYINAVDYPRTHQLEMYWLGLIKDEPLSKMKRKYIGTETVYKEEYSDLHQLGVSSLDTLLSKIYDVDPRRSFIAYKFFKDMTAQLKETYRIIRPGGHYCIVIGNNVMRGIRVKSHDILAEIALSDDVGFELDRMFFSGLIRHFIKIPRRERMNGEWVIILKKPL